MLNRYLLLVSVMSVAMGLLTAMSATLGHVDGASQAATHTKQADVSFQRRI